MARIDKTQSAIAVTRAPIDADFAEADWDTLVPVGINANGRVVKGAGQTGVIGIVIPGKTVYRAGQIADIFGNGSEAVECADLAAGTAYYSAADGTISTTDTGTYIGFTVEADRLVITI
ncbi:MAG TPA: hypothetical protein VD864_11235 [Nocardioides sp.]|nr:hypothetical protein [Nocardioides sp.]